MPSSMVKSRISAPCFALQIGSYNILLPFIDWSVPFSQQWVYSTWQTQWWSLKCCHFLFRSPERKSQHFLAICWWWHFYFTIVFSILRNPFLQYHGPFCRFVVLRSAVFIDSRFKRIYIYLWFNIYPNISMLERRWSWIHMEPPEQASWDI